MSFLFFVFGKWGVQDFGQRTVLLSNLRNECNAIKFMVLSKEPKDEYQMGYHIVQVRKILVFVQNAQQRIWRIRHWILDM